MIGSGDLVELGDVGAEDELVVIDVPLTDEGEWQQRVGDDIRRPEVIEVREGEYEQQQPAHDPLRGRDAVHRGEGN